MATSIGNLNFGIDANTAGLRKAITQLNKFRTEVNKTAKSQADGAKKMAAAMTRQESAIKKAFQATLRMQQAQRKAGAPIGEIARTTQAFQKLTSEMTRGTMTTLEFTRSQDAFAGKLGRSQRALKDLQSAAGGDKLNKFSTQLRNLESASVLAVGPLSGIGARIRSLGAIAGRSSLKLVGLFAGFTAGIVAIGKLSVAAVNASRVFESSMARFEAASGSIEIARKQMSFVIKTSQALGLSIDISAKAFSRLSAAAKGTTLEGEGARRVFLAVSKAAAALRLGAGEVEGTFRAIEQMMSKGTVQAEELRGQLGERLPGAFRLAAEAMGVTTMALGKMLKNGEVLAEEFLPKLADALDKAFADKALDNVNSFQGAMNVLANEGLLFSQAFNKAANISGIFIGAIQKLSGLIRFMNDNLNTLIALLGTAGAAMLYMASPAILGGLIKVGAAIRAMAVGMAFFNVIVATNPLVAIATISVRVVAALAALIAVFFGIKFALDATTDSVEDLDSALDGMDTAFEGVTELKGKFKALQTTIVDVIAEIKVYEEVLGFMDRYAVDDISTLITRFKTLAEIEGMAASELKIFADLLAKATGTEVAANTEDVAEAYFRLLGALQLAKGKTELLTTSQDALRDNMEELAEMQLRLIALQSGQEAVDYWDDVETAVREFSATFAGTSVAMEDRRVLEAAFRAALIATLKVTEDLSKAEKKRKDAIREANQALERSGKAFAKANQLIKVMRVRVAELAKGPDSFEVFTKVTEKVMKFRAELERYGEDQDLINVKVREYTELLERQFALTNKVARAAESMAQSITRTLEDLLVMGGSVTDMLHDLANELLRVALRSLFLDKLMFGISKAIGGGAFPGMIPAPAGGGGGAIPGGFASGGSFTLPGAGGSDSVPVSFFGKPGEVVTIERPDQVGARGGRGGGVVIQQTNIFENIADPSFILPLLVESNRQLKGEIIDGIARGSI